MLREFFLQRRSPELLWAWFGLSVVLGQAIFSAYIKFAVNKWFSTFYDLLQTSGSLLSNATHAEDGNAVFAESQAKVWREIVKFGWIVLPAMLVSPLAKWIRAKWALLWRMCLMRTYMDAWDPNVPPIEGASQRLHEDTQRFAKGLEGFLSTVLNAICILFVFTPILLSLGGRIYAPYAFLRVLGAGWLLGCAVAAASLGLGMAVVAGRRLVDLEVDNQKVEAELRTTVCILETTPERLCPTSSSATQAIADDGTASESSLGGDAGSEAGARPNLAPPAPYFASLWTALQTNYELLFRNFFYLNLWLSCFDQVMIVAPYFLAAPLLFSADPEKRITLGTLVQISNSFGKVFESLSIVSENCAQRKRLGRTRAARCFAHRTLNPAACLTPCLPLCALHSIGGFINEWRSTLVRLRQFEAELFRSHRDGAKPRESRGLIRSRKSAAWTAVADEASDVQGGHQTVDGAEMLPVTEWQRGAGLAPANELHKRVVESAAARV